MHSDGRRYTSCDRIVLSAKETRKKGSRWSKNWLLRRSKHSHINLLNERHFEPSDWSKYLRISDDAYLYVI